MQIDLRYKVEKDDDRRATGERLQEVMNLLVSFIDEVVEKELAENDNYTLHHPALKTIKRAKSGDYLSLKDIKVVQRFIQKVINFARESYAGQKGNFAQGVRASIALSARITNEYFEGVYELSQGKFPLLAVE